MISLSWFIAWLLIYRLCYLLMTLQLFKVDRKDNIFSKANDTDYGFQIANNLILNIKNTKCLKFTLTNVPKVDSTRWFSTRI